MLCPVWDRFETRLACRCTASASLLDDLATLARNTITTAITPYYPLTVLTRPTLSLSAGGARRSFLRTTREF